MRERHVLLILLLVLLAALKWNFNPGLGRNSLDGDYYYQVARNVAEGRGLRTDVSLYHQGFSEFPHRTSIYPLWPWMLGQAGRVLPLPAAAVLLPELLYLAALGLLYVLANRVMSAYRGGAPPHLLAGGQVFDAGHAAVLLLGLNPVFFNFTSLPYTEALAFTLSFAAFVALDQGAAPGAGRVWPLLAGLLAGAAFLARSQMVMVVAAVLAALAVAAWRDRRRLGDLALAALGAAVVVLPWAAYLVWLVRPFDPWVLIYFERYRELPEIPRYLSGVPTEGFWGYVRDRAPGLAVAFNPLDRSSYVASFGLAAWLAPLGLLHLLVARGHLRATLSGLGRRTALTATAMLVAGVLMVAPLQLSHSRLLSPWRFHHRHGLPLVLLLLVALCYLLTRGRRRVRGVALALLAASVAWGAFSTVSLLKARFPSGLLASEPELVQWLEEQRPPPVVMTTNAQTLAVFSRAGFHWLECRDHPEPARRLLAAVPIDYVLMYSGEEECGFAEVVRELPVVRTFGSGLGRITVHSGRPDG